MGYISKFKADKVFIEFYSQTLSYIKGVKQPETWSLVTSVSGIQWTSGASVTLTSDRLKTDIAGIVAIDYNATIDTMKNDSRIKIGDTYYRIVDIDNIAKQNKVIQVSYKEES